MTQIQHKPAETTARSTPGAQKPHGIRLVLITLLVLAAAGGFSVARRFTERHALARETEKLAVPVVSVVRPASEPAAEELTLPAQLQAYTESSIYSRTSGYLLHWYKDIGSKVRKGELLAEIDTPEIDQELLQARASRQQIEAQLQLARTSAERWTNLRKTDSVSQQEADQQTSAYTQAQANLSAADANVRRLEQLESFKHIYAPFSGVITRRNIDVGALITAGSAGQAKELFDIAQVDPLRVYVSVPQGTAPNIRAGMDAHIRLAEYPGHEFAGKVVRTADAIDPATRTLLTEIDVPNKDGRLLPGAYAEVHFAVPIKTVRMSIPVNTLLFRAEGPRVAVVGPDGKIHLKAIMIGRDFGAKVEILNGLDANDQVVVNPADSLEEGQQVNVRSGGAAHS
ncbi:MAG TPA: efflux RND transporter periplasmic adaptor subunit [Candidatus Limnocylindrales bacterium]|nr:efflux RND transporter periplasmic adaptor subunit [Candidatus Limnocylindrales bacterium]